MARKVKFPLELKDGYLARSNIEEVREHFDLEKIIAQFHNGRLKIWLDDHYLPEMAEQVAALDGDAPDLAVQFSVSRALPRIPLIVRQFVNVNESCKNYVNTQAMSVI